MRKIVITVLGGILFLLGFGLSMASSGNWHTIKTEVIWNTVYQPPEVIQVVTEKKTEVTKEVPIYLDKIIYLEKPVTVYRLPEYKPWKDIAEFEAWYKSHPEFESILLDAGQDILRKCNAYALRVVLTAQEEGRVVSQAPAYSGYFYGKMVSPWTAHEGVYIETEPSYGKARLTEFFQMYWVDVMPKEFRIVWLLQ